ncbi:MAG: flagellar hook-basal body protein [Limnochordia bacterium]|jgi:flagellar basal-body rod protein FlgF
MVRGLYTSALGMLGSMERVDILSHNLANVNTPAFKKVGSTSRSFSEIIARCERRPHDGRTVSTLIGNVGVGIQVDSTYFLLNEGPLRETGSQLQAAIRGSGFFVVETPDGLGYTRDGRFLVDSEGWLVTLDGHRVLGENGPLAVSTDDAMITDAGELLCDGQPVGRLRCVDFAHPEGLVLQGGSLYRAGTASGPPLMRECHLAVGFLEESNVNVVSEMVELISATRLYEANQRVILAYDDCLGKAVGEVGKV